jgi:hypothetical protein
VLQDVLGNVRDDNVGLEPAVVLAAEVVGMFLRDGLGGDFTAEFDSF